MRDIVIPSQLQEAMSREAQAAREKQARIILGEAEMEIAHSFEVAARVYQNNPTALHLRAMNMLYEGLKEKGALMLVPSTAVESMGMGGMLGAAALQQSRLTGGVESRNETGDRDGPPAGIEHGADRPAGGASAQLRCGLDQTQPTGRSEPAAAHQPRTRRDLQHDAETADRHAPIHDSRSIHAKSWEGHPGSTPSDSTSSRRWSGRHNSTEPGCSASSTGCSVHSSRIALASRRTTSSVRAMSTHSRLREAIRKTGAGLRQVPDACAAALKELTRSGAASSAQRTTTVFIRWTAWTPDRNRRDHRDVRKRAVGKRRADRNRSDGTCRQL